MRHMKLPFLHCRLNFISVKFSVIFELFVVLFSVTDAGVFQFHPPLLLRFSTFSTHPVFPIHEVCKDLRIFHPTSSSPALSVYSGLDIIKLTVLQIVSNGFKIKYVLRLDLN